LTEHACRIDKFKLRVRELLTRENLESRLISIARHKHVYTCGQRDEKIYLVESGGIKVLLLTPDCRECLTAMYTPGDIFGELSLCGQTSRLETAVAMYDSTVKQISSRSFLGILRRESLLEGLAQYLAFRVAEQQEIITSLLAANSEQRLAMTLVRLAQKLGRKDPRSLRIEQKISQKELAIMVGTTRTRIGIFLKRFREQGLIELTRERYLVVKECEIAGYLERFAWKEDSSVERSRKRSDNDGIDNLRTNSVKRIQRAVRLPGYGQQLR
jgi:CRP/FNR family transcriptional regulator, cyclic AMP receptor protein